MTSSILCMVSHSNCFFLSSSEKRCRILNSRGIAPRNYTDGKDDLQLHLLPDVYSVAFVVQEEFKNGKRTNLAEMNSLKVINRRSEQLLQLFQSYKYSL
jgi:hypothetical protein